MHIFPNETILSKIIVLRNQKVILDRDLARMYGVETRILKRAVRRNSNRFPEDFMFEMTDKELENWISQIGISNSEKMGIRHAPMVFTEHGILMLSSVLRSEKAIEVNIQIIRVFNEMRKLLATNDVLFEKISALEKEMGDTHTQIQELWYERQKMITLDEKENRRSIGFRTY